MPFQKGNTPWIKGKHHTSATKKKISESQKGYKPWRYIVGGWNKGMPRTEEQKEIQRRAMLGRKATKETKKKLSIAQKKRWKTYDATKRNKKISKALGGRKFSKRHKLSISKAKTRKPQPWRRGEKSNLWKGGIADTNRDKRSQIYNSLEYKNWRRLVFERDGYICQKCQREKISRLNAHHIENFEDYPRLRFEVNNGITFCEDCHDRFHKIYGRRGTTKSQVEEYLKKK